MSTLRIGTRKSALAQTQTQFIVQFLKKAFPDTTIETILMTTSGDERPNGSGADRTGGLKALFTKELEDALLAEKIDIAVHSLKDMTAVLPQGLVLAAVPEREDPRDAWIAKKGMRFDKLPPGAKIGTGAARRKAQLKNLRPDLDLIDLRGNVDTRLKKLAEGNLDGIILAMAGLKRLGRAKEVTEILSSDILLPAVGQGALAMEARERDTRVAKFMKALDHAPSHQAALAERAFLTGLGGSCQTPIAGFAEHKEGKLLLRGLVMSPDGTQVLKDEEEGRPFDAAGVGERLAARMMEAGATNLLHD